MLLVRPGAARQADAHRHRTGSKAVFANFETFATLSSTFEDLGVAAYKGQAGSLQGTPLLTTALQIHSVEARHAAEVRRVRGFEGWDGAFDAPLTKGQVLATAAPFLAGGA